MPRRKTFDEFLSDYKNKCSKNGWEEYYIPRQKYVNSATKVAVICKQHGEFMMKPNHLLFGHGCPKCKGYVNSMSEFICKYASYCKSKGTVPYKIVSRNYTGNRCKIKAKCITHGEFVTTPFDLMTGSGCPMCGNASRIKKLTIPYETMWEDYTRICSIEGRKPLTIIKSSYTGISKKCNIICPTHGVVETQPNFLIKGSGCPKCAGVGITYEDFCKEYTKYCAHSGSVRHKVVKDTYSGLNAKCEFTCNKHGGFWMKPEQILKVKNGCSKCVIRKYSYEQAKARVCKVSNNEYELLNYNGSQNKATFFHKECGNTFDMKPINFWNTQNQRCPICRSSQGERVVYNMLHSSGLLFEYQYRATIKGHRHFFDFYIPSCKAFIEVQGKQHFFTEDDKDNLYYQEQRKQRDIDKLNYAHENSCRMIYVYPDCKSSKEIYKTLSQSGIPVIMLSNEDYFGVIHKKKTIAEYANSHSCADTAIKFGICRKTVSKYYKEVYGKKKPKVTYSSTKCKKINNVSSYYASHTYKETCDKYGISPSTVIRYYNICFGESKHQRIY